MRLRIRTCASCAFRASRASYTCDASCAHTRRGGALLISVIAVIVLAGMATAVITSSVAFQVENEASSREMRSLYAAEAGLAEGVSSVMSGAPAGFGTVEAPVAFGGGGYWGTVVDGGDGTMTVTSFGRVGNALRGVEAVLVEDSEEPFDTAVFAGNSGGDAGYDMLFGGKGKEADDINGNVYSGGNVVIKGDADVEGSIHAAGVISGESGKSGKTAKLPDIASMKYETNHDYDVAKLFDSGSTWASSSYGGSAWQMPEASPAHIFRKNPSDRTADTVGTAKDDYFLEDPYETPNVSSTVTAASGSHITVTGLPGKPGEDGRNKVYYIDGNLWVHNLNVYSFTIFTTGPESARLTFVVKGNIYFSDNVLYQHDKSDAVAFIAIKDDAQADSGNIYFGDPTFGTLEQMDAYMYAENDFYDNNLSASGSAKVRIRGAMTAGNKVEINRDFGKHHSKLTVDFDDRLSKGTVTLPGLPPMIGGGANWTVRSWREIAAR